MGKLSAIRENINKSHISVQFLCLLSPSYETLVTALEARLEFERTVSFIRSKLSNECTRRIENSENWENSTEALKTQRKHGNKDYKTESQYCSHWKMRSRSYSECWFQEENIPTRPHSTRNVIKINIFDFIKLFKRKRKLFKKQYEIACFCTSRRCNRQK